MAAAASAIAFDASWGKVGDRGSISISASYAEQKELVRADRNWARCGGTQQVNATAIARRWADVKGDGRIDNRHPETGQDLCFGFQMFNSTAFETFRYEPSLTNPYDTTNPYYDPRVALLSQRTGTPVPFYTRVPVHGFLPGQPPLGIGTTRPRAYYDNEGRWLRA